MLQKLDHKRRFKSILLILKERLALSQLRQNLDKKDKKKKRKKDKKEKKGDKERRKEKKHKRRSSSSDEEEDKKHRYVRRVSSNWNVLNAVYTVCDLCVQQVKQMMYI